MGPSHPATHGTVKFLIELDGENIVNLDIQVGYLHRGFEKECEAGTWYQAIPYTDRLNYNSAVLANLGFCMAVEKLLELETPERCQWLRVLAGELSRLGDHLTRCGAACLELPGDDALPLRHRGARADLGPPRDAVRRARHVELHPHRRREARHAERLPRELPRLHRAHARAAARTSTTSSPATASSSTACATPA